MYSMIATVIPGRSRSKSPHCPPKGEISRQTSSILNTTNTNIDIASLSNENNDCYDDDGNDSRSRDSSGSCNRWRVFCATQPQQRQSPSWSGKVVTSRPPSRGRTRTRSDALEDLPTGKAQTSWNEKEVPRPTLSHTRSDDDAFRKHKYGAKEGAESGRKAEGGGGGGASTSSSPVSLSGDTGSGMVSKKSFKSSSTSISTTNTTQQQQPSPLQRRRRRGRPNGYDSPRLTSTSAKSPSELLPSIVTTTNPSCSNDDEADLKSSIPTVRWAAVSRLAGITPPPSFTTAQSQNQHHHNQQRQRQHHHNQQQQQQAIFSPEIIDLSGRNLPPASLRYGIPQGVASIVTELRFDDNNVGQHDLPTFLDVVKELFPNLKKLSLKGNPCCYHRHRRHHHQTVQKHQQQRQQRRQKENGPSFDEDEEKRMIRRHPLENEGAEKDTTEREDRKGRGDDGGGGGKGGGAKAKHYVSIRKLSASTPFSPTRPKEEEYDIYAGNNEDDDDEVLLASIRKAAEAAEREAERMRRLYVLYRLPYLESIDGIVVTEYERALGRPLTPSGQRVRAEEWLACSTGSYTIRTRDTSPPSLERKKGSGGCFSRCVNDVEGEEISDDWKVVRKVGDEAHVDAVEVTICGLIGGGLDKTQKAGGVSAGDADCQRSDGSGPTSGDSCDDIDGRGKCSDRTVVVGPESIQKPILCDDSDPILPISSSGVGKKVGPPVASKNITEIPAPRDSRNSPDALSELPYGGRESPNHDARQGTSAVVTPPEFSDRASEGEGCGMTSPSPSPTSPTRTSTQKRELRTPDGGIGRDRVTSKPLSSPFPIQFRVDHAGKTCLSPVPTYNSSESKGLFGPLPPPFPMQVGDVDNDACNEKPMLNSNESKRSSTSYAMSVATKSSEIGPPYSLTGSSYEKAPQCLRGVTKTPRPLSPPFPMQLLTNVTKKNTNVSENENSIPGPRVSTRSLTSPFPMQFRDGVGKKKTVDGVTVNKPGKPVAATAADISPKRKQLNDVTSGPVMPDTSPQLGTSSDDVTEQDISFPKETVIPSDKSEESPHAALNVSAQHEDSHPTLAESSLFNSVKKKPHRQLPQSQVSSSNVDKCVQRPPQTNKDGLPPVNSAKKTQSFNGTKPPNMPTVNDTKTRRRNAVPRGSRPPPSPASTLRRIAPPPPPSHRLRHAGKKTRGRWRHRRSDLDASSSMSILDEDEDEEDSSSDQEEEVQNSESSN